MEKEHYTKASQMMLLSVKGSQEGFIRELLHDKEYAVIEVPSEEKQQTGPLIGYNEYIKRFPYLEEGICGIRDIGSRKTYYNLDYYIWINESKDVKRFRDNIENALKYETKLVVLSDIEKLLNFLSNRELVFRTFYFDSGNYESVLVSSIIERRLHVKKEDMNIMNDDFFDVRIYLQEITDKNDGSLKPILSKNLDITGKMIAVLDKESKNMSYDKTDFTCEYDTEEGEIAGHYFLTRFHCYEGWDYVNILNFRFSAFVLPGTISYKESKSLPDDKIVTDEDGRKYILDSIHFTSDICHNLKGFEELMALHYIEMVLD